MPWTWAQVAGYIRYLTNIYEMVSADRDPDTAMPPHFILWDPREVRRHFDERREHNAG